MEKEIWKPCAKYNLHQVVQLHQWTKPNWFERYILRRKPKLIESYWKTVEVGTSNDIRRKKEKRS
jgi:hypothetical protein